MRTRAISKAAMEGARSEIRAIEEEAGLPSVFDQPLNIRVLVQPSPSRLDSNAFRLFLGWSYALFAFMVLWVSIIALVWIGKSRIDTRNLQYDNSVMQACLRGPSDKISSCISQNIVLP